MIYNIVKDKSMKGHSKMELDEFLSYMNSGKTVAGGSEEHMYMSALSAEAIRITTELNNTYHTGEEIVEIFSRLTSREIDPGFRLFPPFTTDCGKNINIGKNVFINSGCRFQDQGGIYIGDGALIGHNVIIATLNHGLEPEHRQDLIPSPVRIGKGVWIGSGSIILPGVSIGENAVIGAGSVVTRDVDANTVVAGNPARVIRKTIL